MSLDAAPAGLRRMRHLVPWLGFVFVAAIVALAVLDAVRGYDATVRQTHRELQTQARIVAEQTARSMQAVDVVLRHVQRQYRDGPLKTMSAQALHEYLREQAVGLVQIDGLIIARADGSLRATSVLPPEQVPQVNVSRNSAFSHMRDTHDTGFFLANAVESPVGNRWVFPMSRRLEGPDGEFAGIVGARGRVDYYQDFYRDTQVDAATKTTLMHRNGTLLARWPAADSALGKHFDLFDEMLAAQAAGRVPTRSVSPVDGVERFGALAPVPDFPMTVIVTRDVDAALAPWRSQVTGSVLRTVVLAAFAGVLLWLGVHQLARLEATRESLERARERFALAVHGSDDGIWDWDQPSDTLFSSQRARDILGIPNIPEALPAKAWFDALDIHPEDEPRRRVAFEDHIAGKTPAYEIELRLRQPDGEYRWARVRGVLVRNAQGRPHRMAGSIADIDARRRAEDALRESEGRFALAVAGSNDGIIDWDIVNDRMFSSLRAMSIAGVDSQQTLRTRAQWLDLLKVHPDDRARFDEDVNQHLQGRTPVREGDYRMRHPNGDYRWVRVRGTCVRDTAGRAVRWAGSLSDIDDQKRTEHALRQSEERYSLAVAGSNEGLWDWDLRSDMLFLSPRAQSLMGRAPGQPLRPRREWIELSTYHPEDIDRVRRAIALHLRGDTPHFQVEYRLRHASGEWRWYRQRGLAVRREDGTPYRLAGSMEDITDRHLAQAERDRLEVQLRRAQKLEAIGTLAGGIAHDFNNILAAILGYGEMAQKEAAEGTAHRRHIDAAVNAGLRAKSLVGRILAFSRSGVGERVPVHVRSVVMEALELVEASLPHCVQLVRSVETGDVALLGDPTQIHQVVMNLCANALQAMGTHGGVLSVAVDTVELNQSLVVATSTLPPGNYVRLRVSDTGVGMAPQVLERIFDPFFTTKEVGVGTGLGLSLVHGIVTDLGGGIEVKSEQGLGACFTVYLPWQQLVQPLRAVDESVPAGSGETVLLVDDEEALVRMGEETMAELGYEPVGFTSSVAALESFRADPGRFQIVVTDEAMPEMTGSELAKAIREIRADIPIVLVSGYVTPALSARARAAGVREVLSKPLVARDVARSLASALAASQTRADASAVASEVESGR